MQAWRTVPEVRLCCAKRNTARDPECLAVELGCLLCLSRVMLLLLVLAQPHTNKMSCLEKWAIGSGI